MTDMKPKEIITNYFKNLKKTIDIINQNDIEKVYFLLLDAYKKEKNIFIMGNGGSASTSSHFACDINKGVSYGVNKRFKVISLADSITTISAYANDVCYEDIFLEQLKNLLQDGDIIIGISGSGNSKNVLRAIEYANLKKCPTIGITGYDGGDLMKIAKNNINVPINNMQITEDIHMILVHILMNLLISGISDHSNS